MPLRDHAGQVVGAVDFSLEVSARKTKEVTQQQAQRLRSPIEAQHRIVTGPLAQHLIMQAILKAVVQLCHAPSAMVGMSEDTDIVCTMGIGLPAGIVATRLGGIETFIGKCISANMSLVVRDAPQDPRCN